MILLVPLFITVLFISFFILLLNFIDNKIDIRMIYLITYVVVGSVLIALLVKYLF